MRVRAFEREKESFINDYISVGNNLMLIMYYYYVYIIIVIVIIIIIIIHDPHKIISDAL